MQPYNDSRHAPHHIGGRRLELGPLADVYNPANGALIRQVHQAEGPQIVQAVESARLAQQGWEAQPAAERGRVLLRFVQIVAAQREELIALIVTEQGKTLAEADDELRRGLEMVEYAAAAPELLSGRHSAEAGEGLDQWTIPQALGVTVGVTPFNAPFLIPMWMAPLALACGNAFILKPSPLAPSCAVWVAEALLAAGLPPGVFQVLQGGEAVVQGLLHHPDVAALSFVGSSKVARQLYAKGGEIGKRVSALGGAKNHLVVMPDLGAAELEAACTAIVDAAYGLAGQRCMAVAVLVLVGNSGDALMPRLAERVRGLRLGPPAKAGTELGPVSSHAAKARIEALIHSGELDGAKLVVDGRGQQVAGHLHGYYLGGTLFDHVQPWMRIYQEEIFGPVLVCLRVRNLDCAIELIHGHPNAQAVSLYTRDGGVARRFTQTVQAGMVGINIALPLPRAWIGAGGWKGSLYGDLQAYGPEAVRFYTRRKAVMQAW